MYMVKKWKTEIIEDKDRIGIKDIKRLMKGQ